MEMDRKQTCKNRIIVRTIQQKLMGARVVKLKLKIEKLVSNWYHIITALVGRSKLFEWRKISSWQIGYNN